MDDDGVWRRRARIFGSIVDEYERLRPGYPAALFDDVVDFMPAGSRTALEIGAGTGKATVGIVERGVEVTAVEPDELMAARLAGIGVSVHISTFEEFEPPHGYGLVYAAQSWHWTDAATRWATAARALVPGGALALFWNADRPADDAVVAAIHEAHRLYAPDTDPHLMPDNFGTDEYDEMMAAADFVDQTHRWYPTERTLDADDYVALLDTTSAYRILDEDIRTKLFGVIREACGDRVVLTGRTALAMARRRP